MTGRPSRICVPAFGEILARIAVTRQDDSFAVLAPEPSWTHAVVASQSVVALSSILTHHLSRLTLVNIRLQCAFSRFIVAVKRQIYRFNKSTKSRQKTVETMGKNQRLRYFTLPLTHLTVPAGIPDTGTQVVCYQVCTLAVVETRARCTLVNLNITLLSLVTCRSGLFSIYSLRALYYSPIGGLDQ